MSTPKEFLECFFQERMAASAEARVRLAPVYARYFGEPLLQHAQQFMPADRVREVVDEVRQSDGVATAIVRTRARKADLRARYRLAASGEGWKIIGIDHECFWCRGTGESGGARCQKCDGEGWYEPDRGAV